ncbi:MAG: arylsulfatase [Gemmataceae bacterium]|nr:arylsulfatase [Gemmataceae bacterium]MDW8264881.1 arylsulfatase [Gemmataceae bacterium]
MLRRRWFGVTLLLIGALGPALAATSAGAAELRRPNVIIVLTDDQGYGDFSCHGNPVLKTPHLDKLHAESIRLTDFHVAPMCTPTRGQLMSGLDALRTRASSVCAGRSFLPRGVPTMAEIFAANGYRTAMFGKWHLGDTYPNLPHHRGFQEAVYHLGWGITSMADVWENDLFDGRFHHNGALQTYKGYCTDVWFNLAIDWMKERHARGEPFFLYLPTNAPHGPHWVPEKYQKPYQGNGPAAFFGMIANIDENMGRLDQFLRETGLYDNTLLFFSHDNGGTAGVNLYNAGMRGRKTTYYEGGHRAAAFFRWPAGRLLPPGDIDALTQVQDILPTLIELCGLTKPKEATFDGISLAGLLRGTVRELPDRVLVVQYGQRPVKGDCAVLWRKWRLVHGKELYDLRSDPGQQNDVAANHPDVFRKLSEYYDRWWAGIEPNLDNFNPLSLGADQENPTRLTAADWANVYCDNMRDLREGVKRNGPWHVLIEKDGEYEIALRRWPKEADAPIRAGVPEFKAVVGGLPAGKALPIAKARLQIAGFDETRPVGETDKEVVFTVQLKAGKTVMQSWFYDSAGQELCGAYFAYVRRK